MDPQNQWLTLEKKKTISRYMQEDFYDEGQMIY